ncbi:MAG: hypothetical protein Q7S83_03350 [bacterium]|nr:hypothetical protein [bacterium]
MTTTGFFMFMLVAVILPFLCVIVVRPRTGMVLANLSGGHRSVGPGLQFIFRFFEWPDVSVSLDKFEIQFHFRPDTASRDVVPMQVVVGCEVSVPYLFEYARFRSAEERNMAVQKRTEDFLTSLVHCYQDPDGVYQDRNEIALKLQILFKRSVAGEPSFEEYYGVKVNYAFLSEIAPLQIIQDAAALKRVNQEKVAALKVMMRGYEKEAKRILKRNPDMTELQATELLMAESGSAPRTVHQIEAGATLSKVINKFTENN